MTSRDAEIDNTKKFHNGNKMDFFSELIYNLRREESALSASFLILMNKVRNDYKAVVFNILPSGREMELTG